MPDNPNNNLCKAHSGIKARMEAVEDDVKELWKKYNAMQKMFLGILVSTCMTLTGIIFLLLQG